MNLTEKQRSIVRAPLGPMIVTAGAGSGKTRVLTHRLAHLIMNEKIPDFSVVALTFTNKAAGEMKRRVENILGGQCNAFLGTFHSFCARLLRKYIQSPYTSDFSIYNTSDTQKVIKEIIASNTFPDFGKDSWKTVEWHLSAMKNSGTQISQYRKEIEHLDACEDILRACAAYEQRMRASNALDFDDLLVKVLEMLESRSELLSQLQRKFKYILVDEFQDTNVIQYKIAAKLAAGYKNIMVVGDEDQCIYTWRGASIENLKSFINDFRGAKVYKLEENFRSSKNIVALANKLVANNTNRLDKVLFSSLPEGIIETDIYADERTEARTIAERIKQDVREGMHFGDFAILIRINAMSRVIEEQLLAYDIPHMVWGGMKFYERAEIKSVINYLRVIVNPKDNVALADIINFPRRGIGETSLEKLMQNTNEKRTLYDVVMNINAYADGLSPKVLTGIKNFIYTFGSLKETYESFGLEALGGSIVGTIGLDTLFKASKKEEDLNRLENVYQLENAIKSFASDNPDAGLAVFLQSVSLVSDADAANPDDSVIISTVHSAKGLEFNTVFIAGLEDGLFPLNRSKNSEAEMEEERRLLYVAITRAQRQLYLSHCNSRFFQGERNFCLPSQFLKEMGIKTNTLQETYKPTTDTGYGYRQKTFTPRDNTVKFTAKNDTAKSLGISPNCKVNHEKFGTGTVLDIIDGNILKIKFDSAGIKMLSLAFAKLDILE